jgi:altronate hydrolase
MASARHRWNDVAIRLHVNDDVLVAVKSIAAGDEIEMPDGGAAKVGDPIPFCHKLALRPIRDGEPIRKFGQIIGFASRSINAGDHVHAHNLTCGFYSREESIERGAAAAPPVSAGRRFDGYLRRDGRVGTRNYLAVIGTVNCSAAVVRRIAERFATRDLADYPNVDGVFAVAHQTGCGMSASGLDRTYLRRTLSGIAGHANVFDCLLVGLGCEVNQPDQLITAEELVGGRAKTPSIVGIQEFGGIDAAIAAGVEWVRQALPRADECRRSSQPAGKLILGTNCGGSDGASGVTANPALGVASDRLIGEGGTSILAETTEIYGAEHLLIRRAATDAVAEKLRERIRWWEWYTSVFGASIDNNPSHGNKAGGLTTIFEKSLGAVAKGGTTTLQDVVGYAEQVKAPGLVFMDTPGFDPVSVTGIVSGGATVVVFTTGRGSVLGSKPAPTIKVATNTPMYDRMRHDMDFDAGTALSGIPIERLGRQLFDLILDVASGRRTASELQNLGADEFVPWTVGPVL